MAVIMFMQVWLLKGHSLVRVQVNEEVRERPLLGAFCTSAYELDFQKYTQHSFPNVNKLPLLFD